MKKLVSSILMLACMNIPLAAKEINKKDLTTLAVSCDSQLISAPTTITLPGPYCLSDNITGDGSNPVIVIDSDNVILNLNGYLIDGNGHNAIQIVSHGNVTIMNGAVTTGGPGTGGTGIRVATSTGIIISNIQAFGCGDSAIEINSSNNLQLNCVKAYSNQNSTLESSVVYFADCSDIELFDVQVNNNLKSSSGTSGNTGIVTIGFSKNVTLTNCTVNLNDQDNDNNLFTPFFATNVNGLKINNSQFNGNSISIASTKLFAPVALFKCTDVVISNCQAVQNQIPISSDAVNIIYSIESSRISLDNCQITDNTAASVTGLSGIRIDSGTTLLNHSDYIINNCQVSGNQVESLPSLGVLAGIRIKGINSPNQRSRTTISDCQLNDNVVVTGDTDSIVAGIFIEDADDITISNTTCNANRGASEAYGVFVNPTGFQGDIHKIRILESIASDNIGAQFSCGIFLTGIILPTDPPTSFKVEQCEVIGTQAHRNTSTSGPGYGFVLQNTTDCSLLDCQANGNGTDGFHLGFAAGSFFSSADTVNESAVIQNCISNNNGRDGFALKNNKNKNRSCFLQNNTAIKNTRYGYYHGAGDVLRSGYLQNYAKGNKVQNYSINGGVIQIRSLSLTTGRYKPVSGGTALTALVNIEAVN